MNVQNVTSFIASKQDESSWQKNHEPKKIKLEWMKTEHGKNFTMHDSYILLRKSDIWNL